MRYYLPLLLLIFLSCQKEDLKSTETLPEENIEQAQPSRVNTIDPSQIPEVIDLISQLTGVSDFDLSGKKSMKYEDAEIMLDSVLELVEENSRNYSFRIRTKKAKYDRFYQLQVSKDINGNLNTPIVREYKFRKGGMDDFMSNRMDARKFRVRFKNYGFYDFFKTKDKRDLDNKNGDCGSGNIGGDGGPITFGPGETWDVDFDNGNFSASTVFSFPTNLVSYTYTITYENSSGQSESASASGNSSYLDQVFTTGGFGSGPVNVITFPPNTASITTLTNYGTGTAQTGSGGTQPPCTIVVTANEGVVESVSFGADCYNNGNDLREYNSSKSGDCGSSGGFGVTIPANVQLAYQLKQKLGISSNNDPDNAYGDWFVNNHDDSIIIDNFLELLNNSDFAITAVLSLVGAELSSDIIEVDFAEELLRMAITEDEFLLLQVPCNQIQNWQNLAQHKPPQEIVDKVTQIEEDNVTLFGDFQIQYLEDAEGAIVNMDYFPIVVNQLPINPATGNRFSATGFLSHIRKNLNSFSNSLLVNFEPYSFMDTGYNETAIWNSNNPFGAIIHIDINAGSILGPSNDGSVIVSSATSANWIFTTIEAAGDWTHPVSGNREFGYYYDSNLGLGGSYVYYVRGVDRITEEIDDIIANAFRMDHPFAGADDLWNSFMQGIESYVNSNGGTGSIGTNEIYRPYWDDVKDVLQGNKSIEELDCN
ncbi:hypothetical protein SAMN04490243_0574 [Robiginitalea myxolifaciens]|uniref:Uncharacterized protein n=1 Tax=Robiginitalea myxolifaciens TaxID=400055 RepID=A0A1I6FSG5_9FLAO|nr:hypothetical protein [Robiginitalea myxolifaciens]SFR32900.1 hypothetical protein SAMN04490243_0574 [Robiginitalea myxolifaciens]